MQDLMSVSTEVHIGDHCNPVALPAQNAVLPRQRLPSLLRPVTGQVLQQ